MRAQIPKIIPSRRRGDLLVARIRFKGVRAIWYIAPTTTQEYAARSNYAMLGFLAGEAAPRPYDES